jgi:hypothetical protein
MVTIAVLPKGRTMENSYTIRIRKILNTYKFYSKN